MHKAIYHKLMDRPYPWEQQDQKPTETHKTKIVLIISLKYQIRYNGDPKRREWKKGREEMRHCRTTHEEGHLQIRWPLNDK
jgi:hypothetical protein